MLLDKKALKQLSILTIFILIIVLTSSCATTITIDHLVPAEYDMTNYRNLEVLPVQSYRTLFYEEPSRRVEDISNVAPIMLYSGYQPFSGRSLGPFADSVLREKLLRLHYFTLFPTGASENSAEVKPQARLQVTINTLDIDEYVFARSQQNTGTELSDTGEGGEAVQLFTFHLRQKVYISLNYMIISNQNESLLYSGTVNRRYDQVFNIDVEKGPVLFAPSLTPVCEELIIDAIEDIVSKLTPHVKHTRVALIQDDSGGTLFDSAYKYAKEGNYEIAYQQFFQLWVNHTYAAAGYNAALLAEAAGHKREALEIMKAVDQMGTITKSTRQVKRMTTYLKEHSEAEAQW